MRLSEEMFEVIKSTHKFTKEPWMSKFGITYIGYCHTVVREQPRTTRRKAEVLLRKDIRRIENYINNLLDNQDIPQNHFDAMCSLAYDIGNPALKNSLFFKYYKKGLIVEACSRIIVWSYIKDQLSLAMQYRRNIDFNIFNESDYNIKRELP